MPTYVYEVILDDDEPGQRFEVEQSMKDPALTEHPATGQPVRRVILAPHVAGNYTESAMNKKMKDDKKIGEQGFTKYVKAGDGYYEKRAGQGPDVIHKDGPVTDV